MAPPIQILEHQFNSDALNNVRSVWVQPPLNEVAAIAVFLDGEYYLAHIRAARMLQELRQSGVAPSLLVAYVSHVDWRTRWPESFCRSAFTAFLADELRPWVIQEFGVSSSIPTLLAGLSLTGLSAAFAGLQRPDCFDYVLCQSGSFWWKDCWLTREAASFEQSSTRFYLSVGDNETQKDVYHGNGLWQRVSQIEGCRHMHEALLKQGFHVNFREFTGGHDVPSWRNDLSTAIASLFAE